jgi:3-dehydroquinate synthase
MSEHAINVTTPTANYTVHIQAGLLPGVGKRLDALLDGGLNAGRQRAFVITSPEIDRLWGEQLDAGFPTPAVRLIVPAGEVHKRLSTVERLVEELAEHGADRDSIIVALGGGVIGDLAGFVAAIYMRGIRYVGVPTTLLAQVDSSLGGKTGANLAAGKNLIGAFHHPLAVYADVATLKTLPAAELRAGLQEAVKSGIIRDCQLFDYLEQHRTAVLACDLDALTEVVAASVRVKAEVVSADEREGGLRMILNLGHTLGHAIEAATHYSVLLHGEAVAWGSLAALRIAEQRGTVTYDEAQRMRTVIEAYGPLKPFDAEPAHLVELTAKDKKNRSGARSFVLPVGIGDATIVRDVSTDELLAAAQAIVAEARAHTVQEPNA